VKNGAYPEEHPPKNRPELRFQIEANNLAQQGIISRHVNAELKYHKVTRSQIIKILPLNCPI
jgi:hypothetical protein